MKLITATGYYSTGSSAITNLLEEYDGCHSLGSGFECRIAHDLFGISDLEYYLAENNHRHNASIAVKNFKRLTEIYGLNRKIRMENYPAVFGEQFAKAVDEYIKELAPLTFQGGSHVDIYNMNNSQIEKMKIKNRIYHMFHKESLTVDDASYLHHAMTPVEKYIHSCTTYITYPKQYFIEATQRFFDRLFQEFDDGNTDALVVDQLVPASNTMRYARYFKDLHVISVDRDPRDVFYAEKTLYRGGIIPTEVEKYIPWFLSTRAHLQYEKDNPDVVLRIYFEDLIYHYEETVKKIETFLGLDAQKHVRPKTSLNPDVSIKNIGRWKNDGTMEIKQDIKKIESELAAYLQY